MFEEYFPICFALKKCEKIKGRKKFQKIFYLSKRAGIPINETFKWNMFGPYSKELASKIDFLCETGLLLEEGAPRGDYSYTLTDKGSDFLETVLPSVEATTQYRSEKFFRILNEFNSPDLEKMASIDFLVEDGYDDAYVKTFLEHAKNYPSDEIEKGKELLSKLFEQFREIEQQRTA